MVKIAAIGLGGYSFFFDVDHFHAEGETLHAAALRDEAGGKGYNQAVAAARLGAAVSFLQAAGADSFADECEHTLQEEGVRPFVARKPGARTALASILTDRAGRNRATVYAGAALEEEDVEAFSGEIAKAEILLLQNEVPEEVNARAVALAARHGTRVFYNPAPARSLPPAYYAQAEAFTPNEREAEALDLTACRSAVVTCGKKGALLIEEGKREMLPAFDAAAVDTTGAGDTFHAAFAVARGEGRPMRESAAFAIVAAGLSVTRSGVMGALPRRAEVDAALPGYLATHPALFG